MEESVIGDTYTWNKIATAEGSTGSPFIFTGLDGDEDVQYKLEFTIYWYNTAGFDLTLYPNQNITANQVNSYHFWGNNAGTISHTVGVDATARLKIAMAVYAASYVGDMMMTGTAIFNAARDNNMHRLITCNSKVYASTTRYFTVDEMCEWADVSTKLTSIKISPAQTGATWQGLCKLYKRAPEVDRFTWETY